MDERHIIGMKFIWYRIGYLLIFFDSSNTYVILFCQKIQYIVSTERCSRRGIVSSVSAY